MDPLNDNESMRQQAINRSSQLGRLAAELPAEGPVAAIAQAAQPAGGGRLPAILEHLRQRHHEREHSHAKLRAHEFIMAP